MNFIVEHKVKGHYIMDTFCGVEHIDTSMFKDVMGIWVCDSMAEVDEVTKQLKELRA